MSVSNQFKAALLDLAILTSLDFIAEDDNNLSNAGFLKVKNIKKLVLVNQNLTNLEGIENFTELEELNCSNNNLIILDLSNNIKIKDLNCQNNDIVELKIYKNKSIKNLDCSNNNINFIDLTNSLDLENFDCSKNDLTKLFLKKCKNLVILNCFRNKLKNVDVSENNNLISLNCFNDELEFIKVSFSQYYNKTYWKELNNTEFQNSTISILTTIFYLIIGSILIYFFYFSASNGSIFIELDDTVKKLKRKIKNLKKIKLI